MGYATRHKLTILDAAGNVLASDETPQTNEIWEREVDGSDFTLLEMAGPRASSWQWRTMDEDMAAIARRFPLFVFQIDGKGEDAGDVWRKWWHGEKVAEWHIDPTPPKFNPDDLK